jgi:hypothetical protein
MNICRHPLSCTNERCEKRHVCKNGTSCTLIQNDQHLRQFIHHCPSGAECPSSVNNNHKLKYYHECKYGLNCRKVNDKIHRQRFVHPCRLNRKCPLLGNEKHILQFTHSCTTVHCNEHDQWHKDVFEHDSIEMNEIMPVSELLNQVDMSLQQEYNFIKVDKRTLKPMALDWTRSSRFNFTRNNDDRVWSFVGWEVEQQDARTKSGNVIVSYEGQFEVLPASMLKNQLVENIQFEQPWYRDEVSVFKHYQVEQVFDAILNRKISGLPDHTTFRHVLNTILEHGVPVFIVGGAVRDVIYYSCNHRYTDINEIASRIKDIDMAFGCSSRELQKIINKYKWKCKVLHTGLIQIGDVTAELFLEGKPINGINNDRLPIDHMPRGIGSNLHFEAIYRDFTMNSCLYDPLNNTIVDITQGLGILDTLKCILRISVLEMKMWDEWLRGNPSKLLRYWKFMSKGDLNYRPSDDLTRQFIITNAMSYRYSHNAINSYNTLEIGIKNRRNDQEAQFKQQLFMNAIIKDLGYEWYEYYFMNKPVSSTGTSNSSRTLTPYTPSSTTNTPRTPNPLSPRSTTSTPRTPRTNNPLSPRADDDILSGIDIILNPPLPAKITYVDSRLYNDDDVQSPVMAIAAVAEKLGQYKGKNPVTNLIDLTYLLIYGLIIIAILVFTGFEIAGIWKNKNGIIFSQIQNTLYNIISIAAIAIGWNFQFRLTTYMRFANTLVNTMKQMYGKYLMIQILLISIAVIIQAVSMPMSYEFRYNSYLYYLKLALYASLYLLPFGFAITALIMMWIKDTGTPHDDESLIITSRKRRLILRILLLVTLVIHCLISSLVIVVLYLFTFNRYYIYNLLRQSQYDKYWLWRGFVQILITWIVRGHWYCLILFCMVIPVQGIQLVGSLSVLLKRRWLPHLFRVFSILVTIFGSVSMFVIGLLIYGLLEFYGPGHRPVRFAIPILWSLYCFIIHWLWLIPTIVCRCRLYVK